MSTTPSERSMVGRIAALESWANTENRSARTASARSALEQKFLDLAGGDPKRADALRKAHYQRLALKSAQARRRAKESREAAALALEAERARTKARAALIDEARAVADLEGLILEPQLLNLMLRTFSELDTATELWAPFVRHFALTRETVADGGSEARVYAGKRSPSDDLTGETGTDRALTVAMREWLECAAVEAVTV